MTQIEDKLMPLGSKVFQETQKWAGKERYAIDPLTLITIIQILYKLAQALMSWWSNRQDKAMNSSKKLNWMKRFIIWRYAKAGAKNSKDAKYIYGGLINAIPKFTDSDRQTLFNTVKENL